MIKEICIEACKQTHELAAEKALTSYDEGEMPTFMCIDKLVELFREWKDK
jgi:hypothetical protein